MGAPWVLGDPRVWGYQVWGSQVSGGGLEFRGAGLECPRVLGTPGSGGSRGWGVSGVWRSQFWGSCVLGGPGVWESQVWGVPRIWGRQGLWSSMFGGDPKVEGPRCLGVPGGSGAGLGGVPSLGVTLAGLRQCHGFSSSRAGSVAPRARVTGDSPAPAPAPSLLGGPGGAGWPPAAPPPPAPAPTGMSQGAQCSQHP